MIRGLVLVGVALVAFAACATGGGERPRPEPSTDDEFTLPPGSDGARSGGSSAGSSAGKSIAPAGRTVTGVLAFDDIEGGCAFIEAPDGTRYEVVYPAGWSMDRLAAELRGPAGEVVPAGATLTVTGSIARDRSSICQVGPILVATKVQPASP